MRKLTLIFGVVVMCASAVGAQTTPGSYFDIASLPGTWILKQGGLPRQGLFIADGKYRNTFNPCNTSDYIPVSIKDLTPNRDPCKTAGAASPDVHPHPIPYGVLDSKPFYGPNYTIDTQAFNRVLTAPDGYKVKKLISKVNSGEITTIGDLQKDTTFSKLVIKKSTITPL
jgi:hypothetical protein